MLVSFRIDTLGSAAMECTSNLTLPPSFDAPSQSNSRASPGLNEVPEVLALHAAKGEVEDADGSDGATTENRRVSTTASAAATARVAMDAAVDTTDAGRGDDPHMNPPHVRRHACYKSFAVWDWFLLRAFERAARARYVRTADVRLERGAVREASTPQAWSSFPCLVSSVYLLAFTK